MQIINTSRLVGLDPERLGLSEKSLAFLTLNLPRAADTSKRKKIRTRSLFETQLLSVTRL